jgi:hypothetical protein
MSAYGPKRTSTPWCKNRNLLELTIAVNAPKGATCSDEVVSVSR